MQLSIYCIREGSDGPLLLNMVGSIVIEIILCSGLVCSVLFGNVFR